MINYLIYKINKIKMAQVDSMPPFGIVIPGSQVQYNFEHFGDKG